MASNNHWYLFALIFISFYFAFGVFASTSSSSAWTKAKSAATRGSSPHATWNRQKFLPHSNTYLQSKTESTSTRRSAAHLSGVDFLEDFAALKYPAALFAIMVGVSLLLGSLRRADEGHCSFTEVAGSASGSVISRRAICIGLLPGALIANPSWADEEMGLVTVSGKDGRWSFEYPSDWETTRKPLKTHFEEIEVNSKSIKKCSVGLAVDPIKLANLEAFGDPSFVGERVVAVERSRDGVFDAQLLFAMNTPKNGLAYYQLEYIVNGTRGQFHYLAKVTVAKGYLYVLTAKVKEASWDVGQEAVQKILESFRVVV